MKVTSVSTERTITAALPGPSTEWATPNLHGHRQPVPTPADKLKSQLPPSWYQGTGLEHNPSSFPKMGAEDYIEKLKVTKKSS